MAPLHFVAILTTLVLSCSAGKISKRGADRDIPTIACFGDEKSSTGLIHYNAHGKCYQQHGIQDLNTRSEFEVSQGGRYFVSMGAYAKSYQNEVVMMKMTKIGRGKDISLLHPYADHQADHDSSFTGASIINGVRIPYLDAGEGIKTYLTEATGDSKIDNSHIVMFKLPTNTYATCGQDTDINHAGTITYNQGCNSNGISIRNNNRFNIESSGPYFICLSGHVQNYKGTLFEMSATRYNDDFAILRVASQHHGKESAYDSGYSGSGTVLNCRIKELSVNDVIVTQISQVESGDKLTRAYLSMFKLTDTWFNCVKNEDDGAKGRVSFTGCAGNYGVEDVDNDHNEFKILKSGKYHLSLAAYIKNYSGGHFAVRLERGDKSIITVRSDHEDDSDGFDGAQTVYRDNIWYLNEGDVLKVTITEASEGSKLSSAYVNMHRLE